MKIFLTGGTGLIGTDLRKKLFEKHDITLFSRDDSDNLNDSNFTFLLKKNNLSEITPEDLKDINLIVHLASKGVSNQSNTDIVDSFQVNVTESLKFFDMAIKEAGIKNFLVCGSCFEYGRVAEMSINEICVTDSLLPTNAYSASKAAFSMACIAMAYEFNLNMRIVRPFHVYGPREAKGRLYPSILEAIKNQKDFRMTSGEQIRNFTFSEDLAEILLHECEEIYALNNIPSLSIKNIGSKKNQSVKDFVENLWKENKAKGKIIFGEVPQRKNEVMKYIPNLNTIFSDQIGGKNS